MRTWRLIVDGPLRGARNMAIDRAIQHAVEQGRSVATLRLYRWSPAAVTLGRFQRLDSVDAAAARERGFDVVRRPTGGRGVLHDAEVTYSAIASVSDGIPRGTAASYRHLAVGLLETYRDLGVEAELIARDRGDADSSACYLHATRADLAIGACKLSGSAQVWHGETVLQHGCFVMARDVDAEAAVFRLDAEDARRLAAKTLTLFEALLVPPSVERVEQAAVEGFARGLGISLEPGSLSEWEDTLATTLEAEYDPLNRALTPSI